MDYTYIALDSITKIVKDFENPTIPTENNLSNNKPQSRRWPIALTPKYKGMRISYPFICARKGGFYEIKELLLSEIVGELK